jgi:threonyl-tRNA synthetase
LCTGPVKENEGFYYDANFPKEDQTIDSENLKEIQEKVNNLISKKHDFQRIDVTYDEAVELFKENKFKLELINKHIKNSSYVSIYKVGDFVDLCEGPHLPHSGYIGQILIQKQSGSNWQGDVNKPKTQRIHGISFFNKENYKKWVALQEEIAKRDHRVIGKQQKLFTFEKESPGMVSFLPNGAFIYNKLIEFLRNEYRIRGYQEVITPNVFSIDLWKTSGHYDNFREDMYMFQSDDKWFGMKPMNCPAHCLLFSHLVQSYKDLPLRLADFGVLHRNEISGALTGLTRVRRFQQDDAHIF